jgi:hypothetical protein
MSKSELDDRKRIQAIDLITLAIGRLERVYKSPQSSAHHSEAKIALADLELALNVLTDVSDADHRQVLPVRSTSRCNTLTFGQEVECYGTTRKASLLYCGREC